MNTLGELINQIFETYEDFYDDTDIAALATEATLTDLFLAAESIVPQEALQPVAIAA